MERCILFLAATVLASTFILKGHLPSDQNGSVAFVPWTTSFITIRLEGKVRSPGIYTFPEGVTVADVIKLTADFPASWLPGKPSLAACLASGDSVSVAGDSAQLLVISIKRMKARDCILVGIPLDPNQMVQEDWEALPGIGPKLAKGIVVYRQINGDFATIDAVRDVPGMGEKKFNTIKDYFKGP